MANQSLKAGLHEALLTRSLEALLAHIEEERLVADVTDLRDAEAADRVSRHIAHLVARAIDRAPEGTRSGEGVRIAAELIRSLQLLKDGKRDFEGDELHDPGRVLIALLQRLPDGRSEPIERPLTPLLDTTVFTNAPGEPAVGHELRAEVPSADAIDVVMAFVRWSGVRPLTDALRRHCEAGKPLRILTTTYTNSTEQRALDELERRSLPRISRREPAAARGELQDDPADAARERALPLRRAGICGVNRHTSSSNLDDAARRDRCFDGAMLTAKRAAELAAKLGLDVHETGVCLPCLSIVAFPLDRGDEPKTRGATVSMTPDLWEEGLELPARLALEQARAGGVKDAELAIADIERAGARTTIARAIVRVLALQLVAEMRAPLN